MVSIEEEIEVKYADMVSEVSPHLVSLSNAAFLIVWHAGVRVLERTLNK